MFDIANMIDKEKEFKTIGYWFNEKKSQKFGSPELLESCRKRNLNFKKIDLTKDLEEQEPFDLFFHKLTSIYTLALSGNQEALEIKSRIEKYALRKPYLIIMDPLESTERLLLRASTYDMLNAVIKQEDSFFIPPYVKLEKNSNIKSLLEVHSINFPVVCKPLHAGGGREAHQMAVLFDIDQLMDSDVIPCVAQSFINHNAVLFKIFLLGSKWFVTLRPSLKNFDVKDHPAIFFDSHQVSKPDSSSPLTKLDDQHNSVHSIADLNTLHRITSVIKKSLKSDLLGIDIVIDVLSGKYAIIDVNAFPSYDSVPDVMEHIAEALRSRLDSGPNDCNPLNFHLSLDVKQEYFLQDLTEYCHSGLSCINDHFHNDVSSIISHSNS